MQHSLTGGHSGAALLPNKIGWENKEDRVVRCEFKLGYELIREHCPIKKKGNKARQDVR